MSLLMRMSRWNSGQRTRKGKDSLEGCRQEGKMGASEMFEKRGAICKLCAGMGG